MTEERAIIKPGLKTGAGSSHGKSFQAPIRFVILHTVYDYLGRLATASDRPASTGNTNALPQCSETTPVSKDKWNIAVIFPGIVLRVF